MTQEHDSSAVATLERVMDEMIEMQPMIPPSTLFPGVMMGEERADGLALAAKLVAIQLIHGADERYLDEYCGRALGFDDAKALAPDLTDDAIAMMKVTIINSARNLLSCVERLTSGIKMPILRAQLTTNQVFPDGLDSMLARAEELCRYCQENGIGPYDHEKVPAAQPGEARVSKKDLVQNAFKKLTLGQDFDEVSAELAAHDYHPGEGVLDALWQTLRNEEHEDSDTYAFLGGLPASDEAKFIKQFAEYAMVGMKKGRRHRAHKTMSTFLAVGRTSGKIGCVLPFLAIALFIGLMFTPLSWWLSLIISIAALFAMGESRVLFDKWMVKATAGKIQKTYPLDGEDYAILHRLLTEAATWEENEGSDLSPLLKALPSPTGASTDSESDSAFHGFFYTSDHETQDMVKLRMSPLQQAAFEELVSGQWSDLDADTYLTSYYPIVTSMAHQGYVAWNGASYWVFATDQNSVHVVEFTNGRMRALGRDTSETGKIPGRFRNLLDVMRDWSVLAVGRFKQRPLSGPQLSQLQENVTWTDGIHQRLADG